MKGNERGDRDDKDDDDDDDDDDESLNNISAQNNQIRCFLQNNNNTPFILQNALCLLALLASNAHDSFALRIQPAKPGDVVWSVDSDV